MNISERALARGTLLSVVLRWFIKGIGLISTIVLARLLTPSDYGVLVMAMLVISLVEIFIFSGADLALLRYQDAPDDLVNSAWTLRLIQAAIVSIVVALLAPAAARYFRDDRVTHVMMALSVGIIISAFGNIGPLLARKNLEFGMEIKIGILSKLVAFIVTLLAAYLLRSYWALVLGTYAGQLSSVWLSYRLHPFRPKWHVKRIQELWTFSQWLLIAGIGGFFGKKLDELMLGRIGSSEALGIYNVASDLGQVVTTEISAPVNRSLFPVLSSIQDDRAKSLNLFFSALGFINTFTIPVSIGMCVLATPFVRVVLGNVWLAAIPILEVFAILGAIRFLVSPYYVWLMVMNNGKMLAAMSWLEVGSFVLIAALLYDRGALGLAWARLLSTLVVVLIWVVVGKRTGLSPVLLVKSLFRPVLAGTGMGVCLWHLTQVLVFDNLYTEFFTLVALGAVSYATMLALLWLAVGRPEGVEKSLLRRLGFKNP